jgi:hypothetical protein
VCGYSSTPSATPLPLPTHPKKPFKLCSAARLQKRFTKDSPGSSLRNHHEPDEVEKLIFFLFSCQTKDCWMNCASEKNLDAEYRTQTESGTREREREERFCWIDEQIFKIKTTPENQQAKKWEKLPVNNILGGWIPARPHLLVVPTYGIRVVFNLHKRIEDKRGRSQNLCSRLRFYVRDWPCFGVKKLRGVGRHLQITILLQHVCAMKICPWRVILMAVLWLVTLGRSA